MYNTTHTYQFPHTHTHIRTMLNTRLTQCAASEGKTWVSKGDLGFGTALLAFSNGGFI